MEVTASREREEDSREAETTALHRVIKSLLGRFESSLGGEREKKS
jgi:hypothetical protein